MQPRYQNMDNMNSLEKRTRWYWFDMFSDHFAIEDICFAITSLTAVKDEYFDHCYHLLSCESKKPASEETGLMNGLPCVGLQDGGGTRSHILLPDTQAVSYGITDIGESNIQL